MLVRFGDSYVRDGFEVVAATLSLNTAKTPEKKYASEIFLCTGAEGVVEVSGPEFNTPEEFVQYINTNYELLLRVTDVLFIAGDVTVSHVGGRSNAGFDICCELDHPVMKRFSVYISTFVTPSQEELINNGNDVQWFDPEFVDMFYTQLDEYVSSTNNR